MRLKSISLILVLIAAFSGLSFATDVSACQEINSSGTYELNTSLSGAPIPSASPSGNACILVNASDVVLDCQGHTLSHTTTASTYGIVASASTHNVTIRNCNVQGYQHSYYVYLSDHNKLYNNTAQDWGGYGIYVTYDHNLLENNTVRRVGSGTYGIRIDGNYNNMTNNTVRASSRCLYSVGGDYNRYVDNTFYYTGSGTGFYLSTGASFNLMENNTMHDLGQGVYISGSGNNNLTNNTIYDTSTIGIQIYSNSNYNRLDRNTLENTNLGIYVLSNTISNEIIGNRINGSSDGIYLDVGADGTLVINNTVNNSDTAGIMVASTSTDNVLLEGNTVQNGQYGIRLSQPASVRLVNNTASGNSLYGVLAYRSADVNITDDHYYGNAVDLRAEAGTSATSILLGQVLFDNDAGDGENSTVFSLNDSVQANTAYEIDWVANTNPMPPGGWYSFADKFLSISNAVGSQTLDYMAFHWTEAEAALYEDSTFRLWKYNGTWSDTGATLDTVARTLTLLGHPIGSDYGILTDFTPFSDAILYGASVGNATAHGRYTGTVAGNATTEGGNITQVDANSTQLTERWAAFYGNVSGSIVLKDAAAPQSVYEWSWSPSLGGVVCVSTNSSLTSISAGAADGSDIDGAWSLPSAAADSGNRTFNSTNCSLSIGLTTISNAGSADTGAAGGFQTCALKTAGTPTKPQMLFCSEIIDGGTAWNGATVDYELLVPTPESEGSTETYYFYANLN